MESEDVCINSYDIVLCFHNMDLDNTLCLVNGFLTVKLDILLKIQKIALLKIYKTIALY